MGLPDGVHVQITTDASGDNPRAESHVRQIAHGNEKFVEEIEGGDPDLAEIVNLARELLAKVGALTVRNVNECRIYVNRDSKRSTRVNGHFITIQGR